MDHLLSKETWKTARVGTASLASQACGVPTTGHGRPPDRGGPATAPSVGSTTEPHPFSRIASRTIQARTPPGQPRSGGVVSPPPPCGGRGPVEGPRPPAGRSGSLTIRWLVEITRIRFASTRGSLGAPTTTTSRIHLTRALRRRRRRTTLGSNGVSADGRRVACSTTQFHAAATRRSLRTNPLD